MKDMSRHLAEGGLANNLIVLALLEFFYGNNLSRVLIATPQHNTIRSLSDHPQHLVLVHGAHKTAKVSSNVMRGRSRALQVLSASTFSS